MKNRDVLYVFINKFDWLQKGYNVKTDKNNNKMLIISTEKSGLKSDYTKKYV